MDTDKKQPYVSVLLPVHKVDGYFPLAVDSILAQDFTDFELLIIANGCSDNDFNIIVNRYSANPAITIIRTEIKSLPFALNLGTHISHGNYIARMDADDIADKSRLKHQVAILDHHPDIGIVSTSYSYIDESGNIFSEAEFGGLSNDQIKSLLPYFCCIAHPTVMLRKKILNQLGGYSFGRFSEDYDLWLRIARELPDVKFHRLDKKLLLYRRHRQQATSTKNLNTIRIYNFCLKIREFFLTKKPSFLFGLIIPTRIMIKLKLK